MVFPIATSKSLKLLVKSTDQTKIGFENRIGPDQSGLDSITRSDRVQSERT